jgi:hypothetical protein
MVKSTLSSFRAAYLQASASPPSAAAPTIQHLPRVLYVSDLLFGKGIAHDMVSQCLLAGLVIPGDAVSCVNAEPAVVPVHELLDEIINYPALAFQHGQNPGPEDLLKLLVGFGKHIKYPTESKKAISYYGMKMRVEPGVISKGVNDHHKAWNSVREAKHSTKEDLKAFPGTMAELCQKLPVVFEIDPEKNEYAEYKLPMQYRIESILRFIFSVKVVRSCFGISAYPGLQSGKPSSEVKNLQKRMMLNY